MVAWLITYVAVLGAGIAVLLPLYNRLLTTLKRYHETEFDQLGRPTLFMASPRRSIALQLFIYVGSRRPGIHPAVVRLSTVIGILTPLFVLLVCLMLVWGAFTHVP